MTDVTDEVGRCVWRALTMAGGGLSLGCHVVCVWCGRPPEPSCCDPSRRQPTHAPFIGGGVGLQGPAAPDVTGKGIKKFDGTIYIHELVDALELAAYIVHSLVFRLDKRRFIPIREEEGAGGLWLSVDSELKPPQATVALRGDQRQSKHVTKREILYVERRSNQLFFNSINARRVRG